MGGVRREPAGRPRRVRHCGDVCVRRGVGGAGGGQAGPGVGREPALVAVGYPAQDASHWYLGEETYQAHSWGGRTFVAELFLEHCSSPLPLIADCASAEARAASVPAAGGAGVGELRFGRRLVLGPAVRRGEAAAAGGQAGAAHQQVRDMKTVREWVVLEKRPESTRRRAGGPTTCRPGRPALRAPRTVRYHRGAVPRQVPRQGGPRRAGARRERDLRVGAARLPTRAATTCSSRSTWTGPSAGSRSRTAASWRWTRTARASRRRSRSRGAT
mmetsp:Transcript_14125/g.42715  ORF Transcript_14125/g.42715 Transcript_14125/m.42715 type:complete len:272 (+) Transcript_14125:42-857(+)